VPLFIDVTPYTIRINTLSLIDGYYNRGGRMGKVVGKWENLILGGQKAKFTLKMLGFHPLFSLAG
jgi:hypothetical protein